MHEAWELLRVELAKEDFTSHEIEASHKRYRRFLWICCGHEWLLSFDLLGTILISAGINLCIFQREYGNLETQLSIQQGPTGNPARPQNTFPYARFFKLTSGRVQFWKAYFTTLRTAEFSFSKRPPPYFYVVKMISATCQPNSLY